VVKIATFAKPETVMCNLMKTLTLTILTILTLGFSTPKRETIYLGRVTINSEVKNDYLGLFIEFRVDTVVIAKSNLKKDGSFKISFTTDKEFDVYYRHLAGQDCFIQTIKPSDKDTVKLNFVFPTLYEKEINEVVCPKCNKHDQTIPILYRGQGSVELFELVDSIGNKTFVPYDKTNYYAGCTFSRYDPKYFCKRDKTKF
jgi:hypothetical protein